MKTRTEINILPSQGQIKENDRFLTIGSCFADQMAHFLTNAKFSVVNNPSGICYNPISIANTIDMVFEKQSISSAELIQNEDIFCHFDFHSDYSATAESTALLKMNQSIKEANQNIKEFDVLIITLGTAWAYRHIEQNRIVSNCHKFPASDFERILLDQSEMANELGSSIEKLINENPKLKLIVTVSPIRHTKDGLSNNQLSKSKLVLLAHQLCHKFDQAMYFPSFEIMIDDLRDYRYYERDLIHPNAQALDYINNLFVNHFMEHECKEFVARMQQLNRDLNHRLLHPSSNGSKKFVQQTKKKIKELQLSYPKLNFDEELKIIDQKN